jgi:hypothetical protein
MTVLSMTQPNASPLRLKYHKLCGPFAHEEAIETTVTGGF